MWGVILFRVGPGPSTQVPRALHHNERLEAISLQNRCSTMGPPLRDSLTVENCITACAMPVQCAAMAVPWPGFGVGLRAWEQILFLPRRGSGSL